MSDETFEGNPVEEPEAPKQRQGRKPKPQAPALGRVVIYVTAQGTERPAIITRVDDELVDLTVFNSSGAVAVVDVALDPDKSEGTYSWPVIA